MSFRLAGRAWEEDISSSQKLVLLAQADTASDDGRCWPGRKYLAQKCGMTLRALDHNLDLLIKRGLLSKTLQKRENGSFRSSFYQIFPSLPAPVGSEGKGGGEKITLPLVQKLPEGGSENSAPGSENSAPGSENSAPGSENSAPLEPVFEPVFESKTTTTIASLKTGGGVNGQDQEQNQPQGNEGIDPKSQHTIGEYVRLGRLFGVRGGPPNYPPDWEISARSRIAGQGGLNKLDLEQLKTWARKESYKKTEQREKEGKSSAIDEIKENYKNLEDREKSFLRIKAATAVPGSPRWWEMIGAAMRGEI